MAVLAAPAANFEVTAPFVNMDGLTLADPWQINTDNGYQAAALQVKPIGTVSVG